METPVQKEDRDKTVLTKSSPETGESSNNDSSTKVDNQNNLPSGAGGDSIGLRNRLENQTNSSHVERETLPSSNPVTPSTNTVPSVNGQPSPNQRRGPINAMNNNATVTDTMYQFQVRCVMFLVVAIIIGYMYVQLEHQSIVNRKYQLVPRSLQDSVKSAAQQHSSNKKSSPSESQIPTTPSTIEEDQISTNTRGKPMIDPKFELQAKYLSRVLKTLGDLSRKIESTDNITKPIQGIIEMKASTEEEEAEDENVPDYMKRLGSIISDIKKSKIKNQRELKRPQHDYPDGEIKIEKKPPTKEEEEQQEKWNSFVNELVDAVAKINQDKDINGDQGDGDSDTVNKYLVQQSTDDNNNNNGDFVDESLVNNKNYMEEQVRRMSSPGQEEEESIFSDKSNQRNPDKNINDNGAQDYSKSGEFSIEKELTELEMNELDFDAELDALEEEVFDGLSNKNMYYDSKVSSNEKEGGIHTATSDDSKGNDHISRQERIQSRLKLLEKLLEASKEDLVVSAGKLKSVDPKHPTESKTKKNVAPSSSPQFQDDQLHVLE